MYIPSLVFVVFGDSRTVPEYLEILEYEVVPKCVAARKRIERRVRVVT